jgi:hypothetical protein
MQWFITGLPERQFTEAVSTQSMKFNENSAAFFIVT